MVKKGLEFITSIFIHRRISNQFWSVGGLDFVNSYRYQLVWVFLSGWGVDKEIYIFLFLSNISFQNMKKLIFPLLNRPLNWTQHILDVASITNEDFFCYCSCFAPTATSMQNKSNIISLLAHFHQHCPWDSSSPWCVAVPE